MQMQANVNEGQSLVAAFGEWSQTNIGDHAIHEGVLEFFRGCGWRVHSYDFGALRPTTGPLPGVTEETPAGGRCFLTSLALHAMPAARDSRSPLATNP